MSLSAPHPHSPTPTPLPLRSLGGVFSVRCFSRPTDRPPGVCRLFVEFAHSTPAPPTSHPRGLGPPPLPKGSAGSHRTVAALWCPGQLASTSRVGLGFFWLFFFLTGKTNTEVCPVFQSASSLPGDYSWAAGSKGHSAAELKFLLSSDWRSCPISHSGDYCTATWHTPDKVTHCGYKLFGKRQKQQEDPKNEIWTEIQIDCS